MDIIEDSKNSSIKRSAELYLDAVEQAIATSVMNDGLEDGTYIIDSKGNLKYKDKTIKVDVKNYNFESGTVIIEQGQIKDIKLSNNEKVTTGKELNKIDKWDGKTVKEVTADSNGIYHITKASELAWVAQQVNSGETFEGKTISLDASLDLGGRYDKDGKKLGTEWIPIGTRISADELFPFKGTFEGNNNVISGIYINKDKIDTNESKRLGLFGYVENSTLNNLQIKDSYIKAHSYIGILCGQIKDSKINSIITNNIEIDSYQAAGVVIGTTLSIEAKEIYSYNSKIKGECKAIGGVIGALQSSSSLIDSYSNSVVVNTGSEELSQTGGITGGINKSIGDGLISEATVRGETAHDVGGITGHLQASASVINSVSYASVIGLKYVGGIVGISSGYNGTNTIENIKSYATVHAIEECAGGVLGTISQGIHNVTDVYSKAKVSGINKIGGIIGGFWVNHETTLNYQKVVSESALEGETNVGDFWGYVDSTGIINKLD